MRGTVRIRPFNPFRCGSLANSTFAQKSQGSESATSKIYDAPKSTMKQFVARLTIEFENYGRPLNRPSDRSLYLISSNFTRCALMCFALCREDVAVFRLVIVCIYYICIGKATVVKLWDARNQSPIADCRIVNSSIRCRELCFVEFERIGLPKSIHSKFEIFRILTMPYAHMCHNQSLLPVITSHTFKKTTDTELNVELNKSY